MYTVIQAVHSLLYIVAKLHFFSVVTWKKYNKISTKMWGVYSLLWDTVCRHSVCPKVRSTDYFTDMNVKTKKSVQLLICSKTGFLAKKAFCSKYTKYTLPQQWSNRGFFNNAKLHLFDLNFGKTTLFWNIKCKITVFYLNIFKNVIYSFNGKADFFSSHNSCL